MSDGVANRGMGWLRDLPRFEGDTGAYLRTAMGALALFGVPPEQYWPYDEEDFDAEPPAFCYAFAQAYRTITYFALDAPGTTPATGGARAATAGCPTSTPAPASPPTGGR